MTARRCTRCGHPAVDAVGSPQCSMFDPPDVDPRATDAARAELRAGRVLCSACQRTDEMFPTLSPVVVTAPPHHFPQPVIDHWTRKVEEAERAQAVADLDDEDEDDCAHCCGCADYQGCDTGKAATAAKEG